MYKYMNTQILINKNFSKLKRILFKYKCRIKTQIETKTLEGTNVNIKSYLIEKLKKITLDGRSFGS